MSKDNNADEAEQTENNDEETPMIDPSELSEEQLAALSSNPDVRRMLEYQDTQISSFVPMLANLRDDNEETFELYVGGIEERTGRITENTILKVIDAMIEEWEDVNA